MAPSMTEWSKVLIHPLGLIGFVLFLLFGLLGRAKRNAERRWILPVALAAAAVALLGGIGLAYWEVTNQNRAPVASSPSSASPSQQVNKANQATTSGNNSPIVEDTQSSSVSITYSGSGHPERKESRTKKPVATKANQQKTQ